MTISSGQSKAKQGLNDFPIFWHNRVHRVLHVLKLNKSNQVMSKSTLRKLKPHFGQRMRFVIYTQNVEFSATLSHFLGIKIMSTHNF